jgi:hypothetical protein
MMLPNGPHAGYFSNNTSAGFHQESLFPSLFYHNQVNPTPTTVGREVGGEGRFPINTQEAINQQNQFLYYNQVTSKDSSGILERHPAEQVEDPFFSSSQTLPQLVVSSSNGRGVNLNQDQKSFRNP